MSLRGDAETLNRILGCEHAALQAYQRVLDNSAQDPQVWDLLRMANDHRQAVGRLQAQIEHLGGVPAPGTASVWPEVSRTPGIRAYEDRAALMALRQGAMREIDMCDKALRAESAFEPARATITNSILPMLRRHVDVLNTYLGGMETRAVR